MHLAVAGRARSHQRGRALGGADAAPVPCRRRRCGTSGRRRRGGDAASGPPSRASRAARRGSRTGLRRHASTLPTPRPGPATGATSCRCARAQWRACCSPTSSTPPRAVAATRSRKAKVAAIAELLARGRRRRGATRDGVPRRHAAPAPHRRSAGAAWPTCRAPAGRADADGARGARGLRGDRRRSPGRGRRRPRAAGGRATLFGRATADEQAWLRGVVTGERPAGRARRAGAGGGRGGVRRAAGRRTPGRDARGLAPCRSRSAALTGGEEALAEFGLEVGRPVLPMLASSAPDVAAAMAKAGGGDAGRGRHQARRHPDPGAPPTATRCWSPPAASTTSPTRLPEVVAVAAVAAGARGSCSTARRSRSDDDGRPRPFQETASRTGQPVDARRRRGHAVLLRRAPRRRPRPARRARRRAARGPRRARARAAPGRRAWSPTTRPRPPSSSRRTRSPPGHEGVVVKALDAPYAAGRRGAGLGQGEAGAHPRPGRARGRVGQRPPRGLAVQHPPRRPRPRTTRRLRDARQDLQGDDRRDARLADRALHRARRPRRRSATLRRARAARAGRRDRLRRAAALHAATPAAWRCASPGCVRYRDDKTADEADTVETVRRSSADRPHPARDVIPTVVSRPRSV